VNINSPRRSGDLAPITVPFVCQCKHLRCANAGSAPCNCDICICMCNYQAKKNTHSLFSSSFWMFFLLDYIFLYNLCSNITLNLLALSIIYPISYLYGTMLLYGLKDFFKERKKEIACSLIFMTNSLSLSQTKLK
jgi:hypothetical protein